MKMPKKLNTKTIIREIAIITLSLLFVFTVAKAGSLTPSALPIAQSYTFSDIMTRLTTNASATTGNHSLNATTTPQATFPTLTSIYNAIPTIYSGDFLASSTYFGVTGTVAVKTGDTVVASSSAQGTSLVFTTPVGYYSGTASVTVSTTSANFVATNIANGINIFGIVGTLSSLLYGDNNANQVLTTASSPGSIAVIAGNTAVASSSIQGTSFILTVPQGYYSGASSVTVSTSSTNMFLNQKNQTKDDWVNSGGTTGEYIAEEATWTTVSGSPFSGNTSIDYLGATDLYSGTVKQDNRTGLWWTDIMAVGSTASSTSNIFGNATDGTRPTDGQAIGFCDALNTASFGGYNDWYLPTQKQLMQAYIDGSANNLPNPGYYFWSSTEFYNNTASAWYVALYFGYTNNGTKVTAYYVRCVRS